MSETIWKYSADVGEFDLELPAGAKVLVCAAQDNEPKLWVLVDDEEDATVTRHFFGVMTGFQVPPAPRSFIGTVLLEDAAFVLHIFEVHS